MEINGDEKIVSKGGVTKNMVKNGGQMVRYLWA